MEEYGEALLVIDMQYTFKAARNKRTIRNVIAEIKEAIMYRIPIFFLEYNGHRGTTKQVALAAKGYDMLHVVTKNYDDGCDALMEYLEEINTFIGEFRVCGVNSCCCVARTVKSLIKKHEKIITMVDEACNCKALNCKHKGLLITHDGGKNAAIFQHPNVNIVAA